MRNFLGSIFICTIICSVSISAELTFTLEKKMGDFGLASLACKESVFYTLVPGLGLQVWDLTSPQNPEKVSEIPFDFSGYTTSYADIEIEGDVLYLSDGSTDGALHGFNINLPFLPQRLGRYFFHGAPQALSVHDQKAYVLTSLGELNILNVSDPNNFIPLSCLDVDGGDDLAINFPYVYVAVRNGLAVYDVQDPLNPLFMGEVSIPGNPKMISIGATHAFLVVDQVGVVILDIQDPGLPAVHSTLETGVQTIGVALQEDTLFVSNQDQGLLVYGLSNINEIQLLSQLSVPVGDSKMAFYSQGVLLPGFDVQEQLHVVNVDAKGQTIHKSSLPAPVATNYIQAQGDIIYASNEFGGLEVFDFSSAPAVRIAQLDVPGRPGFLSLFNQTLYLLNNLGDLYAIDINNPATPQLGQSIQVGAISEMKIYGQKAYIAGGAYGLTILDLSQPHTPAVTGHYMGSGQIYDVEIKGDVAYLAQYDRKISVVDISDPEAITLVNDLLMAEPMYRLTMGNDDTLFAVSIPDSGIFYVFDTSIVTAPLQVYKSIAPHSFYEMYAHDDLLFARNSKYMLCFDVQHPFAPQLMGRVSKPHIFGDMTISENHLYFGAYDQIQQWSYHSWRNQWEEIWPYWRQLSDLSFCEDLSNDILGMVAFSSQNGLCNSESLTVDLEGEGFDIVFDEAREKLYVSLFQDDTILVINSETFIIEERLDVPHSPMGLDLSSDGMTLIIALNGNGQIGFLDLLSRSTHYVNVEVETGSAQLFDVVEGKPGFVYVTAEEDGATYMAEIDVLSGYAVSRVADGTIFRGNATFAQDPIGESLYVANTSHEPRSIDKLDLNQVGVPIILESEHGHLRNGKHMCVSPDGTKLLWGGGQLLQTEDLFHSDLIEEGIPFFSSSGAFLYILTNDDRLLKYQTDPIQKLDEWIFPLSNMYPMRQLIVFPNDCKAIGLRGQTLHITNLCAE